VTLQCYRDRPRTFRSPQVSGNAGYTPETRAQRIVTSCKRKPFGAVISIRSRDSLWLHTHTHATRGGFADASQKLPAGRIASRMHIITQGTAACSLTSRRELAGRGRSELESRVSFRTRVYHPNMPDLRLPYTMPIRDQCQVVVGWARLARAMRLAPTISLDFSRSNSRARSDLHSLKADGRPKLMTSPEYCQIGAGRKQRRRLSARTATLASKRPVARGVARRSTCWPLGCGIYCTRYLRD
jgi:hypothetical protein